MASNDGGIQTLETTCQLLRTMESGEFVSVTEVAEEIGVSKGTVYNHLSTLVENGLVVRNDGEYRLGLRLYEIGTKVRNSYRQDAITQTINQLSERCDTRAHFVVEQHGHTFCLQSSGSVRDQGNERLQIRGPLIDTAPGRAILSASPSERIHSYVTRYGKEIEDVAQAEDGAYTLGRSMLVDDSFRSIATIVKQDDNVIGAVSLVFDPEQIDPDTVRTDYSNRVRRAANEIAVNLTLLE